MKIELNHFYNCDCMNLMKELPDNSVDLVLTDIPYNAVNRDGGIRNYNKGKADIATFDLYGFTKEIYRIAKNNIIIFCGKEQFSQIFQFYAKQKGSVRQIIWNKTNPPPDARRIHLSFRN